MQQVAISVPRSSTHRTERVDSCTSFERQPLRKDLEKRQPLSNQKNPSSTFLFTKNQTLHHPNGNVFCLGKATPPAPGLLEGYKNCPTEHTLAASLAAVATLGQLCHRLAPFCSNKPRQPSTHSSATGKAAFLLPSPTLYRYGLD